MVETSHPQVIGILGEIHFLEHLSGSFFGFGRAEKLKNSHIFFRGRLHYTLGVCLNTVLLIVNSW